MDKVNVIGGGLAGVEACYFLLKHGYEVHLYEKRPNEMTPAHHTGLLGELVCSNSLKSKRLDNACGLLKEEMKKLGSIMMEVAAETEVPSGNALSVDREAFAKKITAKLQSFPNFHLYIEDVDAPKDGINIIATGPLTSDKLTNYLVKEIGQDSLFFFDASAPIIKKDSINMEIAYRKSRYDQGDDSYINCPFSKEEYERFYNELIHADLAMIHDFDKNYFEGCMPIEVMAKRGPETLRYGPLKPKGLQMMDRPKAYAVVQLRQDNQFGDLYNIVGFQTNLTYPEQKRVFRMIPGLEKAEFVRYGLMHKNIYLCSPLFLDDHLCMKNNQNVYLAGQIIGVEGYVESAAMGILSAIYVHEKLSKKHFKELPLSTMIGSLKNYVIHANPKDFSPMNANFGIFYGANSKDRDELVSESLKLIDEWKESIDA